jgi:hypothetical protein
MLVLAMLTMDIPPMLKIGPPPTLELTFDNASKDAGPPLTLELCSDNASEDAADDVINHGKHEVQPYGQ